LSEVRDAEFQETANFFDEPPCGGRPWRYRPGIGAIVAGRVTAMETASSDYVGWLDALWLQRLRPGKEQKPQ
jgi:hypothetical protein